MELRDINNSEIYDIENSRQINRELDEDRIPAGKEFGLIAHFAG
jgi:hypothetical protein